MNTTLKIERAFVYDGVNALHIGAMIDGVAWVHKTPFPGVGPCALPSESMLGLIACVNRKKVISPEHWERLGSTSWMP